MTSLEFQLFWERINKAELRDAADTWIRFQPDHVRTQEPNVASFLEAMAKELRRRGI